MYKFSLDFPYFNTNRDSFPYNNEGERMFNEFSRLINNIVSLKTNIFNRFEKSPLTALSKDPENPPINCFTIWQSNGLGTGDDGDLLVKITDSSGTTKTTTLIDFSAV